jgi:hypothetical protein
MANFVDSNTFKKQDQYYTPKDVWEVVSHLFPKDKVVWEACMLDAEKSKSPQILTELGCRKVIYHTELDCLTQTPVQPYDMIITNIPFSNVLKKQILQRFVELDKPFLIILNSLNIYTKYIREIFGWRLGHLQVITPYGKLQFEELLEDQSLKRKDNCSFYCCFLAYKMNLDNEDLWLLKGKNH